MTIFNYVFKKLLMFGSNLGKDERFDQIILMVRALESKVPGPGLWNIGVLDLTGGAPELNPSFRHLVEQSLRRGKHVIDRCNLTVLLLPRFRDLSQVSTLDAKSAKREASATAPAWPLTRW